MWRGDRTGLDASLYPGELSPAYMRLGALPAFSKSGADDEVRESLDKLTTAQRAVRHRLNGLREQAKSLQSGMLLATLP